MESRCPHGSGIKIKGACCEKIFGCHLCHDESQDHPINRAIGEIWCKGCKTSQSINQFCTNSQCSYPKQQIALYYCLECHFLSDLPHEKYYHCHQCGFCRSGDHQSFFHCENCRLDLPLFLQENHLCIKEKEGNCSYCGKEVFDSRLAVVLPPCSHPYHASCCEKQSNGHFVCSKCVKPLRFQQGKNFQETELENLNSVVELRCLIHRLFPDVCGYSLSYIDSDGDQIVAERDEELLEALIYQRNAKVIQFQIYDKGYPLNSSGIARMVDDQSIFHILFGDYQKGLLDLKQFETQLETLRANPPLYSLQGNSYHFYGKKEVGKRNEVFHGKISFSSYNSEGEIEVSGGYISKGSWNGSLQENGKLSLYHSSKSLCGSWIYFGTYAFGVFAGDYFWDLDPTKGGRFTFSLYPE